VHGKAVPSIQVSFSSTLLDFRISSHKAHRDHVGKAEERQKKQETAHRQFLRAENVIVEWQRANEKLPSLREASEREDQLQIQAGSAPPEAKEPLPSEEARSLIKVQGNTLAVIEAATVDIGRSESEKRALVLQRTASWLEQLLGEWTVLAQEQETGPPSGEGSSNEKAFESSSVPAAKAGGIDETTDRPKPLSSDRASTQYVSSGVENISENIGRSTSDRKSSAEQSRGEYTPPGYQDFLQQPTNSHGRSQQAKVSANVSRSPEILQNPPNASQQSTRDAYSIPYPPEYAVKGGTDADSTPDECVSVYDGYPGSTQDKFEDSTPFRIALKRREESTEQYKVDHLRKNMNDLVSAHLNAGVHNPHQYDILAEQIMSNVILKADELQLSEPEARLNRKELIAQAELRLSGLDPRLREMPSSKSRKGDAVPTRGSNLKHVEIHDSGYGRSGGQTPDLSGTSPPRYGPTEPIRYQIVDDKDYAPTILVDPEDCYRWAMNHSRGGDRHDRLERPTDSRPRSSRGASYQHSEVEPRSTPYRPDSAPPTQPRSSSLRESPSGSRQMDQKEPYIVQYPNVKTPPRVHEKDIKYSRHGRRPSIDEDYFPYSRYRGSAS
jgi:hypothetical protein